MTGESLFGGDSPPPLVMKHHFDPLALPATWPEGVPQEIAPVLEKALAKEPGGRYSGTGEFAAALAKLLAGEAPLAGKPVRKSPKEPQHGKGAALAKEFAAEPAHTAKEPSRPAAEQRPKGQPPRPRQKVPGWAWAMGGLLALGLVIILTLVIVLMLNGGGGKPTQAVSSPTSVSTYTSSTQPPVPSTTPGPAASPVDGMVIVYVPEGSFTMGSDADDALAECQKYTSDCDRSWFTDEEPVHTVYLYAYWIDETEVTNTMFEIFVQSTGCTTDAEKKGSSVVFTESGGWEAPGANWQHPEGEGSSISGKGNYPVVHVSWNDAQAYCEWAGRRLPTEAEWEKATRGTDARIYPWGAQPPAGNLLNFADVNLNIDWAERSVDDGYQFTAPVGSYPSGASPYGALDMAGNVWEWVADWYSKTYYGSSPSSNPLGPTSGQYRVYRGGSWSDSSVRSAERTRDEPGLTSNFLGFRCALSSP